MAKNYGPPELYSSSDSDFEEYGLMSSFDYDEVSLILKCV